MEYKRFGSRMVLRIDRGEEVLTQLRRAAEQEGIRLAAVNGLGAVGDFTVGVFHTAEKQYHAHRFQGDFEIVSLVGTITTSDGEFYAHLHMSAGDTEGRVLGGHLNEAVISATCEARPKWPGLSFQVFFSWKWSYTARAAALGSTASSCTSSACEMALTLLKCFSSAFFRTSPMPGMPSRREVMALRLCFSW